MPSTKASSPAMLRKTIRRVRLEKLWLTKNCHVRRDAPTAPSVRSTLQVRTKKPPIPPRARASALPTMRKRFAAAAPNPRCQKYCPPAPIDPACAPSISRVLSSTLKASHRLHPTLRRHSIAAAYARPPVQDGRRCGGYEKQLLLEPVTNPIQSFDHIERIFSLLEFFSQALDVAVDGTVVDVHLIVVGGIHQGVATFDHTGSRGKRLQDQELRDRKGDRLVLPGAGVPFGVHAEGTALQHLSRIGLFGYRAVLAAGTA